MVLCVAGRYSLPLPALPGILVPARTSSETTRREIHLMTNFVYVNIVYFDVIFFLFPILFILILNSSMKCTRFGLINLRKGT